MFLNTPKPFSLTIETPEKVFFDDEVTQVIVSTPDGELGIMSDYMPTIAVVSEGVMRIEKDGAWHSAALSQGFMDITASGTEIFVDTAEWAEDIDVLRSEAALRRAEERLRGQLSHNEYMRTHAAVARASARLKATKSK